MLPAAIHEEIMPKSDKDNGFCLKKLRGFNWRVDLGILPSLSKSSTIDDLRRATADSRRSYASLRRRLLIDPHVLKNGTKSVDLEIDNPLSQNPDSTWGRFFRNAELEKTVDQDLSRLYPEHGSYFQTPGCQGMLRRILLLWCLKHPEYGYKQGMHELLAPLLYVLHVDVNHLSEVRKQYENYFADKFDGLSFHENDLTYNLDFKRVLDSVEGEIESPGNSLKVQSLDQLDAEIQTIVLLCDAYGAEGELGIVLSEKFMEHDAYCLFDALMNGGHGSVAMADFFSFSPAGGSHSGLPPVIEASAALYHLLSLVDSSLHSHLIELGVEPQYFALRWLRVLFGREFLLEDLLLIWDEIFAADNSKLDKASEDDPISMFCSHRGALIVAIAVSILLYLRSCLLATENATTCLQRLLNFPVKIDLRKLMAKAKSLQAVALDANSSTYSTSFIGFYNRSKSAVVRGHTLSFDSVPSKIPLNSVPDSYWEEKWRVLHNTEDSVVGSSGEQKPSGKKRWVEKAGQALSRTESDPSPVKKGSHRDFKPSVRRSLLEDLSCELGMDEDIEKACCQEESSPGSCLPTETVENHQDRVNKEFTCTAAGRYVSGSSASENSSEFSDPCSLLNGVNEHENYLDKSSVGSNSSVDESDDHSEVSREEPTSRVSHPPTNTSEVCERSNEPPGKTVAGQVKQKISGNFQWFWKFRRSVAGEETSDKGSDIQDATKDSCKQGNNLGPLSVDGSGKTHACGKEDVAEQKVMGSLRNLGQSMLEHIQVIESVFQQERGQAVSLESLSKNVTVGKGQITALTALKELRKISNLLSEM